MEGDPNDIVMHEEQALDGLVPLSDVQIVDFCDWYDGPIDGIARWSEREYWFAGVYPIDRHPRRYVLHEVDAAGVTVVRKKYRQLARFAETERQRGGLDPSIQQEWDQAWAARPDHRRTSMVGWFTEERQTGGAA